jgi:hypothetical protein
MKIVPMKLIFIFICALCCNFGFAAPNPPPPIPPPPPGLPIDGGIFVLLVVALLFGLYKIQSYKKRATN